MERTEIPADPKLDAQIQNVLAAKRMAYVAEEHIVSRALNSVDKVLSLFARDDARVHKQDKAIKRAQGPNGSRHMYEITPLHYAVDVVSVSELREVKALLERLL